ncbi:MAG: polysaccharide biosynthesis tyrosine autokinase [Actinomycetota bacterium]
MSERRESGRLGLRAAFVVLRRRLWVLLTCALLVPASALGFSLVQEKQYTAAASLFFRDPGLDQKLFGSTFLEPAGDPVREAATNLKLVSLKAVARRTAVAVRRGLTADQVAAKVEASTEGQSDLVSVRATDPSPEFAATLANTFAQQYIQFRREADRAKVREAQQLVQRELDALSPTERESAEGRSLAERAQQLRILTSLQTGNAELVERAEPPRSPSSPRTFRNGVLGGVLGVILGIGLAFLLERLDRRVRDPKEIESAFRRPILGTIPKSRALASPEYTQDGARPAVGEEAFRMLRANLRYFNVDRQIQSVLVTSPASADGKSTVAWGLAAAAAEAGARVLLIEADLRHPTLSRSFPYVKPEPGLSTVLAGSEDFAEAVQKVPVHQRINSSSSERAMYVLPAGPLPPNPADLIESERMREVIRHAEDDYDLVVIDTPPTSVVSDAIPLVKEVSGVIVVVRLGQSTREAIVHLRNQLEHLDAPTLGVVLNAFSPDSGSYGYGYAYSYGYGEPGNSGPPAPLAAEEVSHERRSEP